MKSFREQLKAIRGVFASSISSQPRKRAEKYKRDDAVIDPSSNIDSEYTICTICSTTVKAKNLNKHKRRIHNIKASTSGNKKKKKRNKRKEEKRKRGNSSLFGKSSAKKLPPEKKALKERVQRRGYEEGAHVPSSNITKHGKY